MSSRFWVLKTKKKKAKWEKSFTFKLVNAATKLELRWDKFFGVISFWQTSYLTGVQMHYITHLTYLQKSSAILILPYFEIALKHFLKIIPWNHTWIKIKNAISVFRIPCMTGTGMTDSSQEIFSNTFKKYYIYT